MAKTSNPAPKEFEASIKRSMPKALGAQADGSPRVPWVYHPPDTPQRQVRCRACKQANLRPTCPLCKKSAFVPEFTPPGAIDYLASYPSTGTEKMRARVVPQITLGLECKYTQGEYLKRGDGSLHALLPFKRLTKTRKPHQESTLEDIAAAGGVAGILWLVESGPEAECWFINIIDWLSFRAVAKGVSMPLSAARIHGRRVEPDAARGSVKRYWKMAKLLGYYGCAVQVPKTKRPARRPAMPPVKLFDDLPAPQETLDFAPKPRR